MKDFGCFLVGFAILWGTGMVVLGIWKTKLLQRLLYTLLFPVPYLLAWEGVSYAWHESVEMVDEALPLAAVIIFVFYAGVAALVAFAHLIGCALMER